MSEIDFTPHERCYTVVCNSAGEEIDRKEGRVLVKPKDYEEQLPVECRHVKVTTEIMNVYKIEK